MLKKTFYIKLAVSALVFCLLAFSVYTALNSANKNPDSSRRPGDLKIQSQKGAVFTRDFTQEYVESSKDALALAEEPAYSIVFYKQEQVFNITLLAEPLAAALDEAERALMEKLDLDTGEACRLKVAVRVPYAVSQKASGREYGLSFCPKARSLEF